TSLDIELDPPDIAECEVEEDPILVCDDQPAIGHGDRRLGGPRMNGQLFASSQKMKRSFLLRRCIALAHRPEPRYVGRRVRLHRGCCRASSAPLWLHDA